MEGIRGTAAIIRTDRITHIIRITRIIRITTIIILTIRIIRHTHTAVIHTEDIEKKEKSPNKGLFSFKHKT